MRLIRAYSLLFLEPVKSGLFILRDWRNSAAMVGILRHVRPWFSTQDRCWKPLLGSFANIFPIFRGPDQQISDCGGSLRGSSINPLESRCDHKLGSPLLPQVPCRPFQTNPRVLSLKMNESSLPRRSVCFERRVRFTCFRKDDPSETSRLLGVVSSSAT